MKRTAPYLGEETAEPLAPDFDVELGYLYRSGAVLSEDDSLTVHDDPRRSRARPGSRLPHAWVQTNTGTVSTLDVADSRFTVLRGPDGAPWDEAAGSVALAHPGLDLAVHPLAAPGLDLGERFGIDVTGALLVRPDGFVAWRSRAGPDDPARALGAALERVLTASA